VSKNGSKSTFEQVSIGARAGLNWYPLNDKNLYVAPWIALTYNQKISGSTEADGENYQIAGLSPFATLHIGYRF
jgi:hypothetical protein